MVIGKFEWAYVFMRDIFFPGQNPTDFSLDFVDLMLPILDVTNKRKSSIIDILCMVNKP